MKIGIYVLKRLGKLFRIHIGGQFLFVPEELLNSVAIPTSSPAGCFEGISAVERNLESKNAGFKLTHTWLGRGPSVAVFHSFNSRGWLTIFVLRGSVK